MIFTVLLVPPFLLCVLLALGSYEEHMLDSRDADAEPGGRHLRAVPASGGRHATAAPRRARHGRHAA
ncbi:hypothetical protein ACFWUW_15395 [Streptomyces sp. NPDC058655]|uniref:hypothetical protein n=1 Tax=Streptomyces sp. NPDC058655 TaxID=3346577 RepID=UPI0036633A01